MIARPEVKKIGVVVNQAKPHAAELLDKLRAWSSKKGIEVCDTISAPLDRWLDEVGLLICLGGDGTLLSAAGKMTARPVPIMGVNLGRLGFMTEVRQEEMFEELEIFLAGRARIDQRFMLACHVRNDSLGIDRSYNALNDVVVSREGLTRMVSLSILINGEMLTCFSGDGVIVATPTGSTAYSLSAGGAVVDPRLKAILVTPICPHALSLRPLVISCGETITVRLEGRKGEPKAVLTIDGQEDMEIDDQTIIRITQSSVAIHLITSSRRGYFEMLKENFKLPN